MVLGRIVAEINSTSHSRRFRAAMDAGDTAEATVHLAAYVRARPHRADEQFLLGRLLLNTDRPVEAAAWLQRAVALAPGQGEFHGHLGRALLRLGRRRDAEAVLRRALALRPGWLKAMAALGRCLHDLQSWHEAEPLLRHTAHAWRQDGDAHLRLGVALLQLARPVEAMPVLVRAAALAPHGREQHLALARGLYELGRYDDAASRAALSLALAPNMADALHLVGLIQFARNRLHDSFHALWRAAALAPDRAETLFFLGRTINGLNLPESATAIFARAAELRPGWAEALFASGLTARRINRHADSTAALERAVASRPDWPEARFLLSAGLLDLDRPAASTLHLAAAAGLAPEAYGSFCRAGLAGGARVGPLGRLANHASTNGLPIRALPRDDGDPKGAYDLIAVPLAEAAVLGRYPMVLAADGTLLVDGIAFTSDYMRDEPCLLEGGALVRGAHRYRRAGTAEVRYPGAHLFLGAFANFGHWLINNLCRLRFVECFPELAGLPLVVPDSITARQRDWLSLAGYGAERLTIIGATTLARFETLWLPTTPWRRSPNPVDHGMAACAPRFLAGLADRIAPDDRPGPRRRLYLARGDVSRRRLLNEAEALRALAPFDFEVIDPSRMSAAAQVQMVRQAEIIAAPMGAALGIAALARKGTAIVEMRLANAQFDMVSFISATNGLAYRVVFGRPAYADVNPLFDDFTVPAAALARTVAAALSGN
jgi:capsular polysaccharide biosynthesis protein/tetratricopeptide (TPR) repeat protein